MGPMRSTSVELPVEAWNDLDYLSRYFNTSKRALLVPVIADYVIATMEKVRALEASKVGRTKSRK